ncbi:hypothetical protein [Paraburkholderia sp. SG-MS1]|uniref:hypothetical protein n=1 Tax=Paraburkholderia sp. SG-MS1 TaxID=2023741 RepID=UPI00144661C9|nr:hypothetical protein [Paraburkholderia sp. SG-MS1]
MNSLKRSCMFVQHQSLLLSYMQLYTSLTRVIVQSIELPVIDVAAKATPWFVDTPSGPRC